MGNVLVKVRGLHTYPSEVSQIPDGAMLVADNVVIDRESVVEQRPGFGNWSTGASAFKQMMEYKDTLHTHLGTTLRYYNSAGSGTSYTGSFSEPAHNDAYVPKIKSAELNSNFYFTTNSGIYKVDALGATPSAAGMPKGLDMSLALSGASGFMATDTQVAYRVVWARKDANNNLILGAPGQRTTIANSSGGSRDVAIVITIPQEITVNDFLQVYRSAQSINAATEPNDELGLVYEVKPTASEISARSMTFTDSTTDELRGATIYTAASQEGISQANDTPPQAKDITVFKNCTFLANTITKQRLNLTMLAASGASGVNYREITGDTSSGTDTILNASSTTGLAVGQTISGLGIPAGTTITIIAGSTLTMSANATATNVGTALELSDTITIGGVAYSAYDLERSSSTVTMTIASPCVVTWTGNALSNGSTVKFTTTGALPTGLVAGTTYYVVNVAANTFEVAATYAGASINTSGTQSGVHTAVANDARFKVSSGGTPSQNISDTSQSLVRTINRTALNTTIYAYYLSQSDDLPGQIFFESRALGASAYTAIASSHSTAWNPNLPTSGSTVQSAADAYRNGLYISKVQRPEAYPLLQFLRVGATDDPIQRILPLRESLIIMKTDGVYRLTGDSPANFSVDILDNTVFVTAPETAVKLNNQIYAYTNQGICTISDTGVAVISRPIEDKIKALPLITNFETIAFAVSYETSRKYIIFLPTVAADTYATQEFVFNTFTGAWTRWTRAGSASYNLQSNDKLYFGNPAANGAGTYDLLQERKTNSYVDYCDEVLTFTIASVADDVVTLNSVTGISVGDAFVSGSIPFSTITAIDTGNLTVTVSPERAYVALASASVYKRIVSTIQWAPQYMGFPGVMKQVRDFTLLTKDRRFKEAVLTFSSNLSRDEVDVTLTGFSSFLWGYFAWGSIPWGGGNPPDRLRTYIPTESQRCDWLIVQFAHSQAYQAFGIEGFTLAFNNLSERTGN